MFQEGFIQEEKVGLSYISICSRRDSYKKRKWGSVTFLYVSGRIHSRRESGVKLHFYMFQEGFTLKEKVALSYISICFRKNSFKKRKWG